MQPTQTGSKKHKLLTQFLREFDLSEIRITRKCDRGRDVDVRALLTSSAAYLEPSVE